MKSRVQNQTEFVRFDSGPLVLLLSSVTTASLPSRDTMNPDHDFSQTRKYHQRHRYTVGRLSPRPIP